MSHGGLLCRRRALEMLFPNVGSVFPLKTSSEADLFGGKHPGMLNIITQKTTIRHWDCFQTLVYGVWYGWLVFIRAKLVAKPRFISTSSGVSGKGIEGTSVSGAGTPTSGGQGGDPRTDLKTPTQLMRKKHRKVREHDGRNQSWSFTSRHSLLQSACLGLAKIDAMMDILDVDLYGFILSLSFVGHRGFKSRVFFTVAPAERCDPAAVSKKKGNRPTWGVASRTKRDREQQRPFPLCSKIAPIF